MKKLLLLAVLVIAGLLTYPQWKSFAAKSKWFIIADNIGHGLLRRTHLRSDQMGGEPRAAFNPVQLKRIDDTFNSYFRDAGLTRDAVKGKTVLEIGPGDYVGVALNFLAAGAQEVVCIEKYVHFQDTPVHRLTYRALRDGLTPEDRERFDRVVNLNNGINIDKSRSNGY